VTCFVCESSTAPTDIHHIIPQSDGGTDGPTVSLCPTCHRAIHTAAKAIKRGKTPDVPGLHGDALDRALGLAHVIATADVNRAGSNKRPLLAVVLDAPEYMLALKKLQSDMGFKSQAATINAILRGIAQRYGLLDGGDKRVLIGANKQVSLRDFRSFSRGFDRG
jgi:hypothetical protein